MNGVSLDFIGKVQGLLKKASPLFQTVKKIRAKVKEKEKRVGHIRILVWQI
jgi:ABC-type Fe3+-hydroxamate transport system substrate-binding protein